MQQNKDRPGAHVILYTEDRRVLLYRRDNNAPNYKGYWALFSGQMDKEDEGNPRTTVSRELREELDGLNVGQAALQKLCCVKIVREDSFPIIHYFKAFLTRRISELHLKDEGDALDLFSHEDIDRLPVRPEDRLAIERFFQGPTFRYLTRCRMCRVQPH